MVSKKTLGLLLGIVQNLPPRFRMSDLRELLDREKVPHFDEQVGEAESAGLLDWAVDPISGNKNWWLTETGQAVVAQVGE